MAKLKIHDLERDTALDHAALSAIRGGLWYPVGAVPGTRGPLYRHMELDPRMRPTGRMLLTEAETLHPDPKPSVTKVAKPQPDAAHRFFTHLLPD